MQQARALQQSEAFAGYCQRRVVEHRLARLVQLGIRQSRYFGRAKTRFQLYLAATVANLTLIAGSADSAAITGSTWLGQLRTLILLASASLPKSLFPTWAFRPGF